MYSTIALAKLQLGVSGHAFQAAWGNRLYPKRSLFFCLKLASKENDGGWDMIAIAPDGVVSRACSLHFDRAIQKDGS